MIKKKKDYYSIENIQKFVKNNGVNFLPGTIAPAEAIVGVNNETTELESFQNAIAYYKNKGIEKLVMQEKRMGSNVCMYLFKNAPEENYLTTKSGYKRKIKSLTDEWASKVFSYYNEKDLVILGGELEPWSYFGKGLIKGVFERYRDAQEAHNTMEDPNLTNLVYDKSLQIHDLEIDINPRTKSDIQNSYKLSKYLLPLETRKRLNQEYKIELSHYNNKEEVKFIPFSVLKTEDWGRESYEILPLNNYNSWFLFNDSGCVPVDDNSEDLYHQWLKENPGLEGVVIKPLEPDLDYVVPAIKVRNKKFLSLIYGAYYSQNVLNYASYKKCNGKRKRSIRQWKLGIEMLRTDYKNITSQPFINFVIKFLKEEDKLKNLDWRL